MNPLPAHEVMSLAPASLESLQSTSWAPWPEPPLTLEALQGQLEALNGLQFQYLQKQLKIQRACRLFPRSLRTLSLQLSRARRRLIRIEVRIQRREPEGSRSAPQVLKTTRSSLSRGDPLAVAAASSRPFIALSASSLSSVSWDSCKEGAAPLSLSPSLAISSYSLFPLYPFPPPPPSPPPLRTDLKDLREALETFLALQAHHLQDRQRDLRRCLVCLKAIKVLRGLLRGVRARLWRVEAELGIQVPPRELDGDQTEDEDEEEEKEEEEEEAKQEGACL